MIIFAAKRERQSNEKNMKQPERLSIQRMFTALSAMNIIPPKHYYKDGFGVVIGMSHFLKPFIKPTASPYLLEDYRLGIITQGSMHGIINLKEYTVGAGSVVFVSPGSIVEPLGMSDDFRIAGMGVPADMMQLVHPDILSPLMSGMQKHGILKVSDADRQLLEHQFQMLWEIAVADRPEVTQRMVGTIATFYNSLFRALPSAPSNHRTTATEIFDRFLVLVNRHCCEQRTLAFYAGELCLTERYLGTVVKQTSGITPKEWIDRAVISQAKVMLCHSNRQVAEITDALHFPNPSFFCKYFKRLTGRTPQEYRQGGGER